jgi:hypothetical protein
MDRWTTLALAAGAFVAVTLLGGWTLLARARRRDVRRALDAAQVVPRAPFTEARRAAIMEGLALAVESWKSLGADVTDEAAHGNAPMLYGQAVWMARHLDDILRFHANVVPSLTAEDEAPTKPLIDRLRGLLAVGREKGERQQ